MKINMIPALSDNCIWLIEENHQVIIVDPGESQPVLDYLAEKDLEPVAILITHDHEDHVGGIPEILGKFPNLIVYGPAGMKLGSISYCNLSADDKLELLGHHFEILDTPGHSDPHFAYLVQGHLLAGDLIFSGGCGRVFTGDYALQYASLRKVLQLEEATLIYPGHDYRLANLAFAKEQEPDNETIEKYYQLAQEAGERIDLPTSLKLEKEINLLLMADTLQEFMRLRMARDKY